MAYYMRIGAFFGMFYLQSGRNPKRSRLAVMAGMLVLLSTLPAAAIVSLPDPGLTYVTNADSTITITGYTCFSNAVTIPSSINGRPVVDILTAFTGCTNLTSVNIPGTITTIGQNTFKGCSNLTSVVIGDGVQVIQLGAFQSCVNLASINIPNSVFFIDAAVFVGDRGLTNLNLGEGLTTLGGGLFGGSALGGCTSLTTLTMPASLTGLNSVNFLGCTNLRSIFFKGNSPTVSPGNFIDSNPTTAYYLPGTTGWSNSFAGYPALLWNPHFLTHSPDFGRAAGGFHFKIAGTTNIPIVFEASADLGGNWTRLHSCTLTNGSLDFTDPEGSQLSRRYYRIRSP